MKHKKTNLHDSKILALVIITLIFERLYNFSEISGKFSGFVAIICFAIGLIVTIKQESGTLKLDFIKAGILIPYYPSFETIRYFLFFGLPSLWGKFYFKNQLYLYKIIVLVSLLFVVYEKVSGSPRVDGFMYSPTIFSCILLISIYAILMIKEVSKLKIFYVLASLYMIFETKSSSIILVAALIILYKIYILIKNKIKFQNKISRNLSYVIIFSIVVISSIFITNNIKSVLSIVGRDNREQSTETRIEYINDFTNILVSNPKTFLIGNGGGFTQQEINRNSKSENFFPLHQDILMLLCDYGLIGFILILILFIKKLHLNYISILILILLSFHNLVLTSQVFLLLIITNNRINHDYNFEKLPGYYNA